MKDSGVATEAIVLRRFDYSESSQIARLYTRRFGRISVLAKGIRRPNPDLLGPLDLGAHGEGSLRPKKGDALSLLLRWRTLTGFPEHRRLLERMTAVARVTELWCEGTQDGDPDAGLFDLLLETLRALESTDAETTRAVLLSAELGFLEAAGFGPRFDRCVACDVQAPPNGAGRVAPGRGGIVCAKCLEPSTPGLLAVTSAERRTLDALLRAGPTRAASASLSARDVKTLRKVSARLLEHALEKDLQAGRYLDL